VAFGHFERGARNTPNAEINVVPLVDVMLVLLVVFIITAPLLTHSVKVDLPQASSKAAESELPPLDLAIAADGSLFLAGKATTLAELEPLFTTAASKTPQPELQIRADCNCQFDTVAKVMSAASRSGLGKIAFATVPGDGR